MTLSISIDFEIPGLYVFGDSLVDVGNNNYLSLSLAKADFPHNGMDFPTGKATGRFSNGKNAADFLAEKVGLPFAPPYLSLVSKSKKLSSSSATVTTGVSFASGGAGIFNGTDELFVTADSSVNTEVKSTSSRRWKGKDDNFYLFKRIDLTFVLIEELTTKLEELELELKHALHHLDIKIWKSLRI
ncbi:putative triacylglycerol lipase [Tanacetum coccineum]